MDVIAAKIKTPSRLLSLLRTAATAGRLNQLQSCAF
jgi:hypothetical protein